MAVLLSNASVLTALAMANETREMRATPVNGDDKSLLVAKIVAMVVLLIITTLCGAIPFILNRYYKFDNAQSPRSAKVVKCLLYFGGGVLFCTTFLHLLPEVLEVCDDLFACKIISPMPFGFGEFLMCCGFLLMYLIEEIIHTWIHRRQKRRGAVAAFERGHSPRSSRIAQSDTENPAVSKENMNNSQYSSNSTVASITDSKECIISTDTATGSRTPKDMPHYNETTEHKSHAGHSHTHFPAGADDDTTASSLRGLLLVLALSLHELFEGLAIGLEDSPGAVWFTFGAVSAHKLVLAFCVGMELVVARTRPLLSVIYIITFSIVSPIGIAIGILVSLHSNNSEPSLAEAILQGIATGTLLYVVFFEILTTNHAGWWAYFSLFIGFLLMFGLQILGGEADAHSGSEYACAMNG